MLSPTLLVQLKFLCEARLLMIDLLSHKFVYFHFRVSSLFTRNSCVKKSRIWTVASLPIYLNQKNYLNLRLKQFSVIAISIQGFRYIYFSVIGPENPCKFLNQSETNRNQSRLVHVLFPALQSVPMFSFWIFIGSFGVALPFIMIRLFHN